MPEDPVAPEQGDERGADAGWSAVADSMPVMVWLTDADHLGVWNSSSWYEFTGRTPDDELGHGWEAGLHPEDRDGVVAFLADRIAGGEPYEIGYRVRRADGEYRRIVDTGVPRYGSDDNEFAGYIGTCVDVTDHIDAEIARRHERDRFRALIDNSFDLVSIYDGDGMFSFASPSHERVFGYPPSELLGMSPVDLLHPDERDAVAAAFTEQLMVTGVQNPVEHRIRHRDGSWVWVESVALNLIDDPAVGGILVNAREVTDRRRAEEIAAGQADILELVARGVALDGVLVDIVTLVEQWIPGATALILIVDEDERVLRVAAAPHLEPEVRAGFDGFPAGPEDVRYPDGLIVTKVVINPSHPQTGEALSAHGYSAWWAAPINESVDGPRLGAIVVLRTDDVKPTAADRTLLGAAANLAAIAVSRGRAQALLAHQATHDTLTGLPNRQIALDRLRRIERQPRHGGPLTAVLFLDIDRFKVLNDSVGHTAGDRLLVEMGDRLRQVLRPGDLVARFGGDEFVMVCEQIGTELDAYVLANRVLEVVKAPFVIDGRDIVVTASIGIAMTGVGSPEALLRDADAAMYLAKEKGRARVEVFDDELRERVVDRLEIEHELRRALDEGAFELHYQPVILLFDNRLAGFESLLRWPHPTRGLLLPSAFLEVADETGLIRPIGVWARAEACRQAAAWAAQHPEWGPLSMGMNISPTELLDRDLTQSIERTIAASGHDPELLAFEVTERLIANDFDYATNLLTELSGLGVKVALDDFGTGAAPLAHLRKLPVSALKINRAFVSGLGRDPFDESIVDAVVDLCRRLDLFSVAEGVETAEQEQWLRAAGCMLAQGHHIAHPMPAAAIEALFVEAQEPITFDDGMRARASALT